MAMIVVTHDLGVACETADRVAVMYAGRFVETGPVVSMMEAPRHPYTLGLMNSTVHGQTRGSRLSTIEGSPPDLASLPPGCSFAPRCGDAWDACTAAAPRAYVVEDRAVRCHKYAERSAPLEEVASP